MKSETSDVERILEVLFQYQVIDRQQLVSISRRASLAVDRQNMLPLLGISSMNNNTTLDLVSSSMVSAINNWQVITVHSGTIVHCVF